jgi:hypothetical protein
LTATALLWEVALFSPPLWEKASTS